MATDEELHDLGDAVGLVVDRLIEPVEGMHRVISDRAFKYVGPAGRPIKTAYDTVVGGVYGSIRWVAAAAGAGAGAVLTRRFRASHPVSDSPPASRVQAAVNAVVGDHLAERCNALAVELSVRNGEGAVAIDPVSLEAAFPNATDHVVVLLHGLGQTEQCFETFVPTLPPAGLTPVCVRYNSGLPVAETAADLADLLGGLVEAWPGPRPQLSLVGYSMGGLVARSALGVGVSSDDAWVRRTEHVVTIGTPHHGSLLAKAVDVASQALGVARTTRPLSDFLDGRSGGIYDLERGDGVATGWEGEADVRHHFVAAVVTGDPRHPLGAAVGDLVVRVSSASGQSITTENVHVIGGRRHFDLLADPDVAQQVISWVQSPRS